MNNGKLVRKNHSSVFKFKVVLSYLEGNNTMSELSLKYGVSVVTIRKWVKIFKDNGKDIFDINSLGKSKDDYYQKELSNLYKKIGELTVERDFLKKVSDA